MENLYIQSFVTAQQAFEAAQLGKNVVCRDFAGEFITLDNFPATVFFKPDYEFAIALQTMCLNGFNFTTPLALDEVENGQEIFVVTPSLTQKVQFQDQPDIITAIKNGFAQRDEKNAHAQLKAICASFGVFNPVFETVEVTTKTKRTAKKTEDKQIVADEIETDSEKLYEKFVGQINAAEYDDDVIRIKHTFIANSHLSDKHLEMLKLDFDRRIAELNGSVETEVESHTQFVVDQPIINEAPVADDGLDDMISISPVEQAEYTAREELLKNQKDLIDRASSASSVAEANALIKYTSKWSEADRKPVLDAINARLVELAKPDLGQSSLLVRIQSAESVEELEKLESEIENCDQFIQERMYQYYNDKKIDLTIPF